MSLDDLFHGKNPEGISGSDEEFQARIWAMVQNLPEELQGQITIISAYRSIEEQEILYQKYLDGTGNLAAKPGSSNHNHGLAMDLVFQTNSARVWAHENASRFGLAFPIASEAWHVEPAGLRDGTYTTHFQGDGHDHGDTGSSTIMAGDPSGYMPEDLRVDNNSMETQLLRVADLMTGGKFNAQEQLRVSDPTALIENNLNRSAPNGQ